jgi:hypothetical protein
MRTGTYFSRESEPMKGAAGFDPSGPREREHPSHFPVPRSLARARHTAMDLTCDSDSTPTAANQGSAYFFLLRFVFALVARAPPPPAKYIVPRFSPFFVSVFELSSLITGSLRSCDAVPSSAAICSSR